MRQNAWVFASFAIIAATCSAAVQFNPIQDVGIRYGSLAPADELRVRNHTTQGFWAKSYIQFDVSSLTETAPGAFLTLHQFMDLNYLSSPVNLNLYAFKNDLDTFDQTSVTWATAPANVTTSGSAVDLAKTVLVSTLPYDLGPTGLRIDGYGWEFNLNQQGVDILNNDVDRRITFILTMDAPSSTFSAYADPRTDLIDPLPSTTPAAYLPTLAVPEPVVFGGMAAASLGLLVRKREKLVKTRLVGQVA